MVPGHYHEVNVFSAAQDTVVVQQHQPLQEQNKQQWQEQQQQQQKQVLPQKAPAHAHSATASLGMPHVSHGSSSSGWSIPIQKVRAVVAVGGTFRALASTGSWEYSGDITYKVVGIPRSSTHAELQALLASRAELGAAASNCCVKVRHARNLAGRPRLRAAACIQPRVAVQLALIWMLAPHHHLVSERTYTYACRLMKLHHRILVSIDSPCCPGCQGLRHFHRCFTKRSLYCTNLLLLLLLLALQYALPGSAGTFIDVTTDEDLQDMVRTATQLPQHAGPAVVLPRNIAQLVCGVIRTLCNCSAA
jgi:hypothetical protein